MSKLMRKGTQRKVTRITGLPAETNFSVFEDFTPSSYVTAADMPGGSEFLDFFIAVLGCCINTAVIAQF